MKRLLLAGGGHAHVEVLRRFAIARADDVEIVVVNPTAHAPYSGMLPGLVAGHYAWRDAHIDLVALAGRAGARLVARYVVAIDGGSRVARCDDGTTIGYDACSVDVGSTPAMSVEGAREHAIAVKPVDRFLSRWSMLAKAPPPDITVVGAGAGGVELLLAMQHALQARVKAPPRFRLVTDADRVLPTHPAGVRRIFERVLAERRVETVTGAAVVRVDAAGVHVADGRTIATDAVFWTVAASAPAWLAASGFAVDDRGFLRVDPHLRSVSHPDVFGAGDCISIDGLPLPKAGVFAVRQGPVLARNLRAALSGEATAAFDSPPTALNLISTGDRYAVMSWKGRSVEGAWVWRWKDWIDRRFMRRYA